MSISDPLPQGLGMLESRLAREMGWLNLPPRDWIPARYMDGAAVNDVIVIGAGVCGLSAAAALQRVGITGVRLLDRAPAGQEGPWITYARMRTLRTRKEVEGMALGLPSLTFRAWFECQFGEAAWAEMDKIPRTQWMEYLLWYRRVLGLQIENDTVATAITPATSGLVAVDIRSGASGTNTATRRIWARRVILATGLDGLGGPGLPPVVAGIDPKCYAHSADMIDMASLKGLRVGVVGAGASAMDNAAAALEAGASLVEVFVRRPDIPRVDKFSGVASKGMTNGYVGLPDADKWRLMLEGARAQIPPPRPSTLRVTRHANAHINLSCPITDLAQEGDQVMVTTPKGRTTLDFLIFATGFTIDLSRRPELSAVAPHIKLWRDVYQPPDDEMSDDLGAHPYLGPGFAFQQKTPGACPGLEHIACFTYPAVLSHGKLTSGIPAASDGAMRLAEETARSIFVEDRAFHLDRFHTYDTPELTGDEYHDASGGLGSR